MNVALWIIFIIVGFMSFVPVIRLTMFKEYLKYRTLRYLMYATFFWTLAMFMFYLVDDVFVIYITGLLVYPIVFLIVCLGHETVQGFIGHKTPSWLKKTALVIVLGNLVLALTNSYHHVMVSLSLDQTITRDSMIFATPGIGFYIHTALSYLILMKLVVKLLVHLRKPVIIKQSTAPFYLILFSVVIGFIINITHVFFFRFYIDPTYIFFVLFSLTIYHVIFNKDFEYALLSSSRKVLINAMREMYVIADENGIIVEFSKKLLDYIGIPEKQTKTLSDLLEYLQNETKLYHSFDEIEGQPFEHKHYLYSVTKTVKIKGFKQPGTLLLLYDETRLVSLVDTLNYLKNHDIMTDLYNRNYVEEHTGKFEKTLPRFGLIIVDVNGLKLVNDTYGHKVGDQLLIDVADHLKTVAEKIKQLHLIRLGGDEFLIIVEDCEETSLESVEKAINAIPQNDNRKYKISVTTGSACRKGQSLEKTFSEADNVLYSRKPKKTAAYRKDFDNTA